MTLFFDQWPASICNRQGYACNLFPIRESRSRLTLIKQRINFPSLPLYITPHKFIIFQYYITFKVEYNRYISNQLILNKEIKAVLIF